MVLSESGEVPTDRRTSERRIMQVGSSVSNRYYTPYQTNTSVKYCAGFSQTEDGKLTPNEKRTQDLTENPGFAEFADYQEFHKAWMSQRGVTKTVEVCTEKQIGAVSIVFNTERKSLK